jgi:hypothetical protein
MIVEEVTVEVSARHAMRKLIPNAPFGYQGASESYQWWIKDVTKAIAEVGSLGEAEAYAVLEKASLRLRDGSTHYYHRIYDPEKYAEHFASLVFDDAASRAALLSKLKTFK